MKMELLANHTPKQFKDRSINTFIIAVDDRPYLVEFDPITHSTSVYSQDTHRYMYSWSKLVMIKSFIKDTLLEMEIA
tara:strand:- start:5411 stop:5641 length:231 start_codon:yes stop_codon:yes gene_type:complete